MSQETRIKDIELKIKSIQAEIILLKESKKNKKIVSVKHGRPVYAEDVGFCKTCGQLWLLCTCPKHIARVNKIKRRIQR